MAWNLSSPITGAAQTGFTSPTYTLYTDTAPDSNGKQQAVTAIGGTQSGVDVHSIARPFTITFVRPRVLKTLGKPNPVTGLIANVPRNIFRVLTRKGVLPLSGQPNQTMIVTTTIEVPAGADLADANNVRAALSAHIGALSQQAAGVGESAVTGIM